MGPHGPGRSTVPHEAAWHGARPKKKLARGRKKKKARGRLLFAALALGQQPTGTADLFITDPTCSIAERD
jgi:hypothetical protein